MLHRLKVRAESFDSWANRVKEALEQEEGNKIGNETPFSSHDILLNHDLNSLQVCYRGRPILKRLSSGIKDLEVLKAEAADKKFPNNELLQRLNAVLTDIQKCESSSVELLSGTQSRRMTLDELKNLVDTMHNLPCVITPLKEVQVRRTKRIVYIWLNLTIDNLFPLPGCVAEDSGV